MLVEAFTQGGLSRHRLTGGPRRGWRHTRLDDSVRAHVPEKGSRFAWIVVSMYLVGLQFACVTYEAVWARVGGSWSVACRDVVEHYHTN